MTLDELKKKTFTSAHTDRYTDIYHLRVAEKLAEVLQQYEVLAFRCPKPGELFIPDSYDPSPIEYKVNCLDEPRLIVEPK